MKSTDTDEFITRTNKQCYDKLGELYADGPDDLEILTKTGAWKDFVDELNGRKILNVGCGAADASTVLIKDGFDLINTDLSEAMIEIARKNCPRAKNLVLNATELDKLKDDNFDGIMAIHLIQHLSKTMMAKFFEQVCKKLNDDGVFFLVFTNTCYEKTGCQLEGGAIEDNKIYWHKWKLEDVVPLLTKAGLKPAKMRNQEYVNEGDGYMEPFVFICKKTRKLK